LYKRINIWLHAKYHRFAPLFRERAGKEKTRCIMQSVVGANLSSEALLMGIKGFVSVHGKMTPEVEITKKKIHRLAFRFSIDFKIYRLAYGFLCVNHKGLAKVYRFLVRTFFSQDFKNP
jgi:hypothetical protein